MAGTSSLRESTLRCVEPRPSGSGRVALIRGESLSPSQPASRLRVAPGRSSRSTTRPSPASAVETSSALTRRHRATTPAWSTHSAGRRTHARRSTLRPGRVGAPCPGFGRFNWRAQSSSPTSIPAVPSRSQSRGEGRSGSASTRGEFLQAWCKEHPVALLIERGLAMSDAADISSGKPTATPAQGRAASPVATLDRAGVSRRCHAAQGSTAGRTCRARRCR